jgi:hypothetical protein
MAVAARRKAQQRQGAEERAKLMDRPSLKKHQGS